MNTSTLGTLALMVVVMAGACVGLLYYHKKTLEEARASAIVPTAGRASSEVIAKRPPIQEELDRLASRMVEELKAEERLSMNMVAQLRGFQETLRQMQAYASKVERDIKIIEEISKQEFQDDVALQASLYAGKKPELVAKHLEEFKASRVGAILAKMKKKEASAVLDVWAKQDAVKVSAFYREVIAAFLNNKRRDANPELFNKVMGDGKDASKGA